MRADETRYGAISDAAVRQPRSAVFTSAAASGTRPSRRGFGYSSHGRAALATALDDGLMPGEVAQILAGRRIVDAFPVWRGESPTAYAARAVSEMFVAYLR